MVQLKLVLGFHPLHSLESELRNTLHIIQSWLVTGRKMIYFMSGINEDFTPSFNGLSSRHISWIIFEVRFSSGMSGVVDCRKVDLVCAY